MQMADDSTAEHQNMQLPYSVFFNRHHTTFRPFHMRAGSTVIVAAVFHTIYLNVLQLQFNFVLTTCTEQK